MHEYDREYFGKPSRRRAETIEAQTLRVKRARTARARRSRSRSPLRAQTAGARTSHAAAGLDGTERPSSAAYTGAVGHASAASDSDDADAPEEAGGKEHNSRDDERIKSSDQVDSKAHVQPSSAAEVHARRRPRKAGKHRYDKEYLRHLAKLKRDHGVFELTVFARSRPHRESDVPHPVAGAAVTLFVLPEPGNAGGEKRQVMSGTCDERGKVVLKGFLAWWRKRRVEVSAAGAGHSSSSRQLTMPSKRSHVILMLDRDDVVASRERRQRRAAAEAARQQDTFRLRVQVSAFRKEVEAAAKGKRKRRKSGEANEVPRSFGAGTVRKRPSRLVPLPQAVVRIHALPGQAVKLAPIQRPRSRRGRGRAESIGARGEASDGKAADGTSAADPASTTTGDAPSLVDGSVDGKEGPGHVSGADGTAGRHDLGPALGPPVAAELRGPKQPTDPALPDYAVAVAWARMPNWRNAPVLVHVSCEGYEDVVLPTELATVETIVRGVALHTSAAVERVRAKQEADAAKKEPMHFSVALSVLDSKGKGVVGASVALKAGDVTDDTGTPTELSSRPASAAVSRSGGRASSPSNAPRGGTPKAQPKSRTRTAAATVSRVTVRPGSGGAVEVHGYLADWQRRRTLLEVSAKGKVMKRLQLPFPTTKKAEIGPVVLLSAEEDAQFVVNARVVDANTGEPIPEARVFAEARTRRQRGSQGGQSNRNAATSQIAAAAAAEAVSAASTRSDVLGAPSGMCTDADGTVTLRGINPNWRSTRYYLFSVADGYAECEVSMAASKRESHIEVPMIPIPHDELRLVVTWADPKRNLDVQLLGDDGTAASAASPLHDSTGAHFEYRRAGKREVAVSMLVPRRPSAGGRLRLVAGLPTAPAGSSFGRSRATSQVVSRDGLVAVIPAPVGAAKASDSGAEAGEAGQWWDICGIDQASLTVSVVNQIVIGRPPSEVHASQSRSSEPDQGKSTAAEGEGAKDSKVTASSTRGHAEEPTGDGDAPAADERGTGDDARATTPRESSHADHPQESSSKSPESTHEGAREAAEPATHDPKGATTSKPDETATEASPPSRSPQDDGGTRAARNASPGALSLHESSERGGASPTASAAVEPKEAEGRSAVTATHTT